MTWQERGQLAALALVSVLLGARLVVDSTSPAGALDLIALAVAVVLIGYGSYAAIRGMKAAPKQENRDIARLYRALGPDEQRAVRRAVSPGAELDPHLVPFAARYAAARARTIPMGWLIAGGAATHVANTTLPVISVVIGGWCVLLGAVITLGSVRARRQHQAFLARHVLAPTPGGGPEPDP